MGQRDMGLLRLGRLVHVGDWFHGDRTHQIPANGQQLPHRVTAIDVGHAQQGFELGTLGDSTTRAACPRQRGERASSAAARGVPRAPARGVRGSTSAEHAAQQACGTADTDADVNRVLRAVERAGAAFDAGATVGEHGSFVHHGEYRVRADAHAQAAPVAEARVELQRYSILEVPQPHCYRPPARNRPASQRPSPSTPPAICSGTAIRISRRTPLCEVKVVAPVKFIRTKLETVGTISAQAAA